MGGEGNGDKAARGRQRAVKATLRIKNAESKGRERERCRATTPPQATDGSQDAKAPSAGLQEKGKEGRETMCAFFFFLFFRSEHHAKTHSRMRVPEPRAESHPLRNTKGELNRMSKMLARKQQGHTHSHPPCPGGRGPKSAWKRDWCVQRPCRARQWGRLSRASRLRSWRWRRTPIRVRTAGFGPRLPSSAFESGFAPRGAEL